MPMTFIETVTYENMTSEERLKELAMFSLEESNEIHDNTETHERQLQWAVYSPEATPVRCYIWIGVLSNLIHIIVGTVGL